MKKEQKQIILDYVESYNTMDVEGMLKHMGNKVVFESMSGMDLELRLEGKEAFRQQAEKALGFFVERRQTVNSWEFNKDVVKVGITYEAVLAVDLPNGLKAGETLRLKGQSIFLFEEGTIKKLIDKS